MAKLCRDVVWGQKYLFLSDEGELLCKEGNKTVLLHKKCSDFDAALGEDQNLHIAVATDSGDLVYIKNSQERWGKGVAAKGVNGENLFVFDKQGNAEIFFTAKNRLFRQKIGAEEHLPTKVCVTADNILPFVTERGIFYVNTQGKLVSATFSGEEVELCEGDGVGNIFVCQSLVCFKKDDGLVMLELEKQPPIPVYLTKRHSRRGSQPILYTMKDEQRLCWCDEGRLFLAKKRGEVWQKIEVFEPENADRLGVFKLDGEYKPGCVKNGRVCFFNAE